MAANLEFTTDEFKVMHDAGFFIHKKKVSDKLLANFGMLSQQLDAIKTATLTLEQATELRSGKISKGENYELLPFFILDNPGVFKGIDVFAFRCMFWWGNYYSCTLHISGKYLNWFLPEFEKFIKKFDGYYFCIGDTPWQYHFRESNYLLIENDSYPQIFNQLHEKQFFKIAFKKPLTNYDLFKKEVLFFFTEVLEVLKIKNQ